MNINEILELLSEDERAKIDKFYSNIIVAQGDLGNVGKVIEIMAKEGLTFKKISDLRTLTIEAEEVVNKIEEYKNAELFDVVRKDVSILRFKTDIILSRIIDCGKTGKSYRDDEGKLYSFITNSDEWDRVFEGLNHEVINNVNEANGLRAITIDDVFDTTKINSVYKALDVEDAQLDLESFDRYSKLMNHIATISSKLQGYGLEIKSDEIFELVVRNMTSYKLDWFLDEEIIISALISGIYVPYVYLEELKNMAKEACILTTKDVDLESSGISL